MSEMSEKVHSVTFTDVSINGRTYNTYDDWGLIPMERPILNKVATSPYLDHRQDRYGALMLEKDYSIEVPTSRTGEWKFKFDDLSTYQKTNDQFAARRLELMTLFSGKYFRIELEDEPGRYYKGLVWAEWTDNPRSQITLKLTCEPFAYICDSTGGYSPTEYDLNNEKQIETIVSGTTYHVPIYSGFYTPVLIEIYPYDGTTTIDTFTIKQMARNPRTNSSKDIVLTDLASDGSYLYYVDGITKTVYRKNFSTENTGNYYDHCTLWRFPMLKPAAPTTVHPRSGLGARTYGDNDIIFTWTGGTGAKIQIRLEYYPRYI